MSSLVSVISSIIVAASPVEPSGMEQFRAMAYSGEVEKERHFYEQLTSKLEAPNNEAPYLTMEALRRGAITTQQAATELHFWGASQCHKGGHKGEKDLQLIELFVGNAPNPQAEKMMTHTFQTDREPYLQGEKFHTFMDRMRLMPPSEQRFLLAPKNHGSTISQVIQDIGVNVFNSVGPNERMIPSMGMMQTFLDVQFKEPVKITPRIYHSTPLQIRSCALLDTRDMMMLFPDETGNSRCPREADGHKAPWYEFAYHDFYHAILASALGKDLRRLSIAAADAVTDYANEPGTEEKDKLLSLSSLYVDMEYHHFQPYLLDPTSHRGQLFWDTLVFKADEIDLSEETTIQVLTRIQQAFTKKS